MSDVPRIADRSAAALFSVSTANWTQINRRVGVVALAGPIAADMTAMMPDFPKLQSIGAKWSATTFPGLAAAAPQVSKLAAAVADLLRGVQALIPASSMDPLPAAAAAAVAQKFGQMAALVAPVAANVKDLSAQIHAFADINTTVDAEARHFIAELGPAWQFLGNEIAAVETATGAAEGAWGAIADDVARIASQTIPITTGLLVSLAIDEALTAWANLAAEADAFAVAAPALQALFANPVAARARRPRRANLYRR